MHDDIFADLRQAWAGRWGCAIGWGAGLIVAAAVLVWLLFR